MESLWYGSDEVREFHPVVEECLNRALKQAGLDGKYTIRHHHGEFTSGIPDFVLLDKKTGDFVCVIEVKKTPSDVFYFESGYQAKGYVDEVYPLRWKPKFFPYFCVTNIEITQFYCWRQGSSLIGCLLTGSPHDCGLLNEGQGCYEKFTALFASFFKELDKLREPEFSMHLEAISESFNQTLFSIAKILGVNLVRMSRLVDANEQIKESILYELLRFAFYYYIKETYEVMNSPYLKNFPDFDVAKLTDLQLLSVIEENFSKAMEIDFRDILQNYGSKSAIIPYGLKENKELRDIFNNFIQTLRDNAPQGIKKNSNLLNFVSLLTAEIYNKEEMHSLGKIMSDETLSNILAEFAIDSKEDKVVDPCCGDGNLLISAYNRLRELAPKVTHNDLLGQLAGVEIDVNLLQLAAFKLICSNLTQVDKHTITNLQHADLFDTFDVNKYDALVMNPPFLRNEDLDRALKIKYLNNLEKVSGHKSFIRVVSQPNMYFFFVQKALTMLKKDGQASIILMTKFLNNEDGKYLKAFLLPYISALISYPPNFFKGFAVTTCIVLLSKAKKPEDKVSFLRIKDTNIFSDLDAIKRIIENKKDAFTDKYSLINIPPKKLDPSANWRFYLVDPANKFGQFESLQLLKPLSSYFNTIQRGKAENCGGSSVIYPFSSNNPLLSDAENIEPRYIGFGLQRNKLSGARRKIILTRDCLNAHRGILFPSRYDSSSLEGIPRNLSGADGLRKYCRKFSQLKIKGEDINLQKIMDCAHGSIVTPKIIIPRADREKHIVFFNPFTDPILMSTNFFYLDDPKNLNPRIDAIKQIKFVAAFLNSSFGQIEFEMHANNQEGMRKIEGFIIEKFKVPDLNSLKAEEVDKAIKALDKLNAENKGFLGIDDEALRNELDSAIGEIIFTRDKLGFKDVNSLVGHFQEFLKELVIDRVTK